MPRTMLQWPGLAAWAVLLGVLPGCQWNKNKVPPEPPPRPAVAQDPFLVGTIGAVTYLSNVEGQPVRGFGVVAGLGENGSRDCPSVIRQHLLEVMGKEAESWPLEDRKRFSPGELIDRPSTAVVEVSGIVPAGAPAGTRFDLEVLAIPGTSTRSLAGGLLLPCELRLSDPSMSYEELLGGPVVAHAGGPVFVNPFATAAETPEGSELRHGSVLGGGRTIDARETRLLLQEPSYPAARRLERRINERFGQRPPVAEAMSRGYLVLHTPPEYARHPQDFLQLVPHVYVESIPSFTEGRLRELARLAVLPNADYGRLSLVWEGIGPTAVPYLQPLYSSDDAHVRLSAARAGLRLKDVNAIPVMGELAASSQPDIALAAIRELGRCQYPQAALKLVPLLDRDEREIRIAAYEALLRHKHPAIHSQPLPSALDHMQLNLSLDVVESNGSPLIYVRRTRVPRIAVFGASMPVRLPVFYADADDTVTINAVADTGDVTLFSKHGGKLSEKLLIPPRVVDLITALADIPVKDDNGRMRGLGLPYSQVVQVLAALMHDGTIAAPLEIERVSLTEVLGPERPSERPESDEPPPVEPSPSRPESETGHD